MPSSPAPAGRERLATLSLGIALFGLYLASPVHDLADSCCSPSGVVIHGAGALGAGGVAWNVEPVDVDEQPRRVFDWQDPQPIRALASLLPGDQPRTTAGGPLRQK